MAMFKAKFRKYWCDYCSEYTEIRTSSIDEILEYVYKTHKESVYPQASKFCCHGKSGTWFALLEANNSLMEKWGYRGSLWLEQITYFKGYGSDEIIIFSKYDRYISPKANEAFDAFEKIAKNRDENKNFGDF